MLSRRIAVEETVVWKMNLQLSPEIQGEKDWWTDGIGDCWKAGCEVDERSMKECDQSDERSGGTNGEGRSLNCHPVSIYTAGHDSLTWYCSLTHITSLSHYTLGWNDTTGLVTSECILTPHGLWSLAVMWLCNIPTSCLYSEHVQHRTESVCWVSNSPTW